MYRLTCPGTYTLTAAGAEIARAAVAAQDPGSTYSAEVIAKLHVLLDQHAPADPDEVAKLTARQTVVASSVHYQGGVVAALLAIDEAVEADRLAAALAAALAADDAADDGDETKRANGTCWEHQAWIRDCVADPTHSNHVTKWNWCTNHWRPVQDCGCRIATVEG
jgi:hypothetical protein